MTTIAGVVITKALQRVRDPQGSAHTRVFVRTILSHAQRIINAIFRDVRVTSTFTTEASRLAYPVQSNLTDNLRIVSITHEGSELAVETLAGLQGSDPSWPRTRGAKIQAFASVGRDLLLLYPALDRNSTVEITSIKDTGLIIGEDSALDLPDERVKTALDFTEILLLIRQRDFDEAEALLKAVVEDIQKGIG